MKIEHMLWSSCPSAPALRTAMIESSGIYKASMDSLLLTLFPSDHCQIRIIHFRGGPLYLSREWLTERLVH